MPETRKPASGQRVAIRVLAWLKNSPLAKQTVRYLTAMVATLVAIAQRSASWARRNTTNAYQAATPRISAVLNRLRHSTPAVRTVQYGGKAATIVRERAGATRDSAFVQQVARRADQSVTAVKNSRIGQLTGNGVAAARRRLPDWATPSADGKAAWSTAVADSSPAFLWRAVVGVAVIAIAAVMLMGSPLGGGQPGPTNAAGVPAERTVDDTANRSQTRDGGEPEDPGTAETAPVDPEPEAPAPKTEEPPADPKPVGGLSKDQMDNAVEIVRIGEDMGISERGQAVALVTAMQESQLLVLANTGLPESLDVPNQGTGYDHDSVGLFQQRPSSGWGTVEECMDVEYSTTVFYKSLERIKGWESMDLTVAAQSVQISAFPDHYAKWEGLAWDVIDEVNK